MCNHKIFVYFLHHNLEAAFFRWTAKISGANYAWLFPCDNKKGKSLFAGLEKRKRKKGAQQLFTKLFASFTKRHKLRRCAYTRSVDGIFFKLADEWQAIRKGFTNNDINLMKTKSQQSNQLIQYAIIMKRRWRRGWSGKMPKVNSKTEKDLIYFGDFSSNAISIAVSLMINWACRHISQSQSWTASPLWLFAVCLLKMHIKLIRFATINPAHWILISSTFYAYKK